MLSTHSHCHTININIIVTLSYHQLYHPVMPSTSHCRHIINLVTISHNKQHCFVGFIITKVISKYTSQNCKVFHRTFSFLFPKEEEKLFRFLGTQHIVLRFFTLSCCSVRIKNIYCTQYGNSFAKRCLTNLYIMIDHIMQEVIYRPRSQVLHSLRI